MTFPLPQPSSDAHDLWDMLAEEIAIGSAVLRRLGSVLPDERSRESQLTTRPGVDDTNVWGRAINRLSRSIVEASRVYEARLDTRSALDELHSALSAARELIVRR